MKLKLFLICLFCVACTNEDGARSTLESMGFTDIRLTGYEPFDCGKGDDTCTGFRAIAPSGKNVTGSVGCGLVSGCSKGCTVRLDQ